MRKKLVYSGIVVLIFAVVTTITFYCRHVYFFNPLTFRNDGVTNLPYTKYRNPLYIEYDFVKQGSDLTQTWHRSVTTDRSEIEQVIGDLRNAAPSTVQPDNKAPGTGGVTYIFLRQQVFPTPRPPSPILLTVRLYDKQHILEILQPNGMRSVVRDVPQSLRVILDKQERESSKPET